LKDLSAGQLGKMSGAHETIVYTRVLLFALHHHKRPGHALLIKDLLPGTLTAAAAAAAS
jgi:hypothetical protein